MTLCSGYPPVTDPLHAGEYGLGCVGVAGGFISITKNVIPAKHVLAKAGSGYLSMKTRRQKSWIPAFAGMTT